MFRTALSDLLITFTFSTKTGKGTFTVSIWGEVIGTALGCVDHPITDAGFVTFATFDGAFDIKDVSPPIGIAPGPIWVCIKGLFGSLLRILAPVDGEIEDAGGLPSYIKKNREEKKKLQKTIDKLKDSMSIYDQSGSQKILNSGSHKEAVKSLHEQFSRP